MRGKGGAARAKEEENVGVREWGGKMFGGGRVGRWWDRGGEGGRGRDEEEREKEATVL